MHVFIGFMVSALRERGLCVMLVRIWDGWVGGWGRLVGGWVSGWLGGWVQWVGLEWVGVWPGVGGRVCVDPGR